ncbi:universal stress protein [Phocaeicola abscessus]|uniref:universal stress protein n=1 Tax=Phocaeicola abscessus TaxID=555313 RepID=UPI0004B25E0E|nr:universal stress protein [Phocaeicola abscessus]
MEDKLVTLAILTYAKAQILKTVLESEGIEASIHNVNLIQPVVSSGVRVRIKESDLTKALQLIDKTGWMSEDVWKKSSEKKNQTARKVLIPVDFSDYSLKACEFGFTYAHAIRAEVMLLHVYFSPIFMPTISYNADNFGFLTDKDEQLKFFLGKEQKELNRLSETIREKVESGTYPDVKYSCVLRDGIPEEEILKCAKEIRPQLIVMGTRGKSQKNIELIGSVTAEVIERSKTSVYAIPENSHVKTFNEIKNMAFMTAFDQRDLIAFDSLINAFRNEHASVSFIHLSSDNDAWNEIKLAGIKDYFQKQYPTMNLKYSMIADDDILSNLDRYVKDEKIDVICITNYRRNIFARLFNPSIARKMIFHANTPILVIK